jgi:hypothetical protein
MVLECMAVTAFIWVPKRSFSQNQHKMLVFSFLIGLSLEEIRTIRIRICSFSLRFGSNCKGENYSSAKVERTF